jgi:hypothetical protein
MAGFAVFMEIITFGFIGIVATALLSVLLYFLAKKKIEKANRYSSSLPRQMARLPIFALVWLVTALLMHVVISNVLAHQDCGLSGDPYVTLPNGYELGSNNTYDGYIQAPGAKTDVPMFGPGYVRSILDLQLIDGKFVGTQFEMKTSRVRHFVFDTRTREFQPGELEPPIDISKAFQEPRQPDPNSYWVMYEQYRKRWPTYVLWALIAIGEVGIVFWGWKVWKTD